MRGGIGRTLLLLAVAASVAAAVALWLRRAEPVATTTLPQTHDAAPDVGPLTIAPGSRLRIATPEFSADLDESGAGRITRMDAAKNPPEPMPEEKIALDPQTRARLCLALGRLKAAWSARKVGEAALSPDLRDVPHNAIPDESHPTIQIEEIAVDGSHHLILSLAPSSPEYSATWDALTPLRLR